MDTINRTVLLACSPTASYFLEGLLGLVTKNYHFSADPDNGSVNAFQDHPHSFSYDDYYKVTYATRRASNNAEAVRLYEQSKFDIVFMDPSWGLTLQKLFKEIDLGQHKNSAKVLLKTEDPSLLALEDLVATLRIAENALRNA